MLLARFTCTSPRPIGTTSRQSARGQRCHRATSGNIASHAEQPGSLKNNNSGFPRSRRVSSATGIPSRPSKANAGASILQGRPAGPGWAPPTAASPRPPRCVASGGRSGDELVPTIHEHERRERDERDRQRNERQLGPARAPATTRVPGRHFPDPATHRTSHSRKNDVPATVVQPTGSECSLPKQ